MSKSSSVEGTAARDRRDRWEGIFAGSTRENRIRMYRILGFGASFLACVGFVVAALAPFPHADIIPSLAVLGLMAVTLLGFAILASLIERLVWFRFGYGVVLVSAILTVGLYYFGPEASLLAATIYIALMALASFTLPPSLVVAGVALIGVEYAAVIALQPSTSPGLTRWLLVVLVVGLMAYMSSTLGRLVSRLREELEDANKNLELRVDEQVSENERLGRLRRFLPSAVASAVVESDTEHALAPHRRQIACVFIDLRGFTRFTSEAEPEEVIDALRAYHGATGHVMAMFGATVGPLQGDGMMAYFNDPLPCDEPTGQATEMALTLRPRLDDFARTWRGHGYELSYGIGVAFGYATMGVVGFEGRQEYTPVGTVANLASRLCDAAVGGQILMDQKTYNRIASTFTSEPLEPIEVKGFDRPVNVVAITGRIPSVAVAAIGGAQEDPG